MINYFLGIDIGGTKSHAIITNDSGKIVGFGEAGPGNHEVVGYDGLKKVLQTVTRRALAQAQITKNRITGAGFGVAGYDWPSELAETRQAIDTLGLNCPIEIVNDAVIGLVAGAEAGWGVALVAGTSNNCWGWDENHRIGRVVGGSMTFGENGGSYELVSHAIIAIAKEWTLRGPKTALSPAFVQHFGFRDTAHLLENIQLGRCQPGPDLAPLVFQVADTGDKVAQELIRWSGRELADLALGVIRQLRFQQHAFDVVLVGSMFNGGVMLLAPLRNKLRNEVPQARLVRLTVPPVAGAVLLGMQAAGLDTQPVRRHLMASFAKIA